MNVMIDGIRYVPELEQSKDKGLLAALEVRFSSDAGADLTVREYLRLCARPDFGDVPRSSPLN